MQFCHGSDVSIAKESPQAKQRYIVYKETPTKQRKCFQRAVSRFEFLNVLSIGKMLLLKVENKWVNSLSDNQ